MSAIHHLGRMSGRDPDQRHRSATPLELLFDLTFVVAFSQISTQTAHLLEIGHVGSALPAFAFTLFGAVWAWINYTWLASAYDNDDAFFRLATMVQMMGVLVFALGIPSVFASFDGNERLDNAVMVAGYVIMRIASVAIWLRAARHDPDRRRTALGYAAYITVVQFCWVLLVLADLPLWPTIAVVVVLFAVEMAGPFLTERRFGDTPWHPGHIAERYGLLVIIALGEVVLGTILTVSAAVEREGWSLEVALLAFGGTALVFALWWTYFVIPFGLMLRARRPRRRPFVFGYLHFFVFAAIVGVGAGLHVAAQVISHTSHVSDLFAIWTVVVPVGLYEFVLFLIFALMIRSLDPLHVWLYAGCVAILAIAVVAVQLGASLGAALVIAACSPAVIVVGYETVGWRHGQEMIERTLQ